MGKLANEKRLREDLEEEESTQEDWIMSDSFSPGKDKERGD